MTTSNATLDLAALYGVLRRAIDHAGGASAFARLHGVTPSYVSDVLHARTPPGPAILDALWLRRMVTYEHTGAAESASTNTPAKATTLTASQSTGSAA